MKLIVEFEPITGADWSKSDWALWILRCICSFMKPSDVKSISVVPMEPEHGATVQ